MFTVKIEQIKYVSKIQNRTSDVFAYRAFIYHEVICVLGNNFMLQIHQSIVVTIHVHVISCKLLFWDSKQRSRISYDFPNGSAKHLFSIPTFVSVKEKQHLTIKPMFPSYILLSFICKYLICTHISYCCRIAYYFIVHDII